MIFRQLYPALRAPSAFLLDYEALWEAGIRGLIFDIDNTLTGDNAPAERRAADLIRSLKDRGFSVCILSNNSPERTGTFAAFVDAAFVAQGRKPGRSGYLRCLTLLGTAPSETAAVGDQIFTDIWGANRAGLLSILTAPLDPRERFHIRLKRILERFVLSFEKTGVFF